MGKLGVQIGTLSANINSANGSVASVGKLTKVVYATTNVKPFIEVGRLSTLLEKELSTYKGVATHDLSTYLAVGNSIVKTDSDIAHKNGMFGGK